MDRVLIVFLFLIIAMIAYIHVYSSQSVYSPQIQKLEDTADEKTFKIFNGQLVYD